MTGGIYDALGFKPSFVILAGCMIWALDLRGYELWQLVLGDLLAAQGGVL